MITTKRDYTANLLVDIDIYEYIVSKTHDEEIVEITLNARRTIIKKVFTTYVY